MIVDQQIADCQEQRLDRTQPRWRSAGTWQATLLVAEKRMAGLGSVAAAATPTARGGAKSNLLHEGFPKLEAPLTVVLVCLPKGLVHIYRERNSPHLHQLAIWY